MAGVQKMFRWKKQKVITALVYMLFTAAVLTGCAGGNGYTADSRKLSAGSGQLPAAGTAEDGTSAGSVNEMREDMDMKNPRDTAAGPPAENAEAPAETEAGCPGSTDDADHSGYAEDAARAESAKEGEDAGTADTEPAEAGKTAGYGISEQPGTSGTSGTSGKQGTSECSGTTDQSGASGSAGRQGVSGSSGKPETSGSAGRQGVSGNSGKSGSSGSSSGSSGETESSGSAETPEPSTASGAPESHRHEPETVTETVYHPAETRVEKHPAQGHYETITVREAWEEPLYTEKYKYVCNTCGGAFETESALFAHQAATYNPDTGQMHGGSRLIAEKVKTGTVSHPAVTEDVWITDVPAWEETITVKEAWTEEVVKGIRCKTCGRWL